MLHGTHSGCSGMHGVTEVRGLCGAMGVPEDAEGGMWGGELLHTGEAAVCSACQEGYYKDDQACTKCADTCATCSGGANNQCTSCPEGKYLKSDKSCSNTCDNNQYADPESGTCKLCTTIDQSCTACKYNATVSKPQCTDCGSKKVKTALDGTTTCVNLDAECATGNTHFKDDSTSTCLQCGDASKGVEHCATCTAAKVCTGCLPGFFKASDTSCTACGANCATCSVAGDANKCSTCMAGFFLKGTAGEGQCVACGDNTQGGIDGCADCDNKSGTLKCTKCKANYNPSGEETNLTCTKFCEDPTACGGTAGSCGAIVVSTDGSVKYYCSQCRQQ
ncbi:Variant-specific surface protein [Giardia duodenalis]|uniref:Variant-specific surface protein n=1 Tax=Giardia intestinalis TaxID=5741 RepID=V6TYK7_GIAIN|nr:Variant-specific surface protein [Giardia intestinalis]